MTQEEKIEELEDTVLTLREALDIIDIELGDALRDSYYEIQDPPPEVIRLREACLRAGLEAHNALFPPDFFLGAGADALKERDYTVYSLTEFLRERDSGLDPAKDKPKNSINFRGFTVYQSPAIPEDCLAVKGGDSPLTIYKLHKPISGQLEQPPPPSLLRDIIGNILLKLFTRQKRQTPEKPPLREEEDNKI